MVRAHAAVAVPESYDPQEIEWHEPREAPPGSPIELDALWSQVAEQLADSEAEQGRRAHRIGTALNRIYVLWGEVVAQERSFKALLLSRLGDSALAISTAYLYMRLAQATTEEEAAKYGITRSLVGLELLPFAGVDTLAALERVELPIVLEDGTPVRFPATRRLLERALLEYRLMALEEKPTRSVAAELRRQRTALDAAREKHPELGELRPTLFVRDGEVKMRMGAFSPRHVTAIAALMRRLNASR